MAIGGEKHQAAQWCKKALEALQNDGLPPTPENYTVYYNYHAGSNPALNVALDTLHHETQTITEDQLHDLFEKHLGMEAEQKFLSQVKAEIDAELKRAMSVIADAAAESGIFDENLSSFSSKLSPTTPVEQIREAVAKVAQETQAMIKQNAELKTELAQTNQQLDELSVNLDRAHRESQIDPLTEIGNRKFFDRELARTMNEARENNQALSLLIVDIDHFKKFNDVHGHLVGDQVLRLVARTLVENLKGRDVIARYGGEEFVILLPFTRPQDAERVGNQLCLNLATKRVKRRISNEVLGGVTISIGATGYIKDESSDNFIARADGALYKAKQSGRNRVVCEVGETPETAQL